MKQFDRTFGAEFLGTVPKKPGVYHFLNKEDRVIYVGKAKDLRKRLQQYRMASGRKKKSKKQREIVRDSSRLIFTVCENETEALLLENQLIQELRPAHNVEGAFSFMYPMIGFVRSPAHFALCYTTSEDPYSTLFQMHGAFRSRELTRNAYLALRQLLSFLGHREKKTALKAYPKVDFSSVCAFRQLDTKYDALVSDFLLGESHEFLGMLALDLLEKSAARNQAAEVKKQLKELKSFFKWEALALREAFRKTGQTGNTFVAQMERDAIFIKARS